MESINARHPDDIEDRRADLPKLAAAVLFACLYRQKSFRDLLLEIGATVAEFVAFAAGESEPTAEEWKKIHIFLNLPPGTVQDMAFDVTPACEYDRYYRSAS